MNREDIFNADKSVEHVNSTDNVTRRILKMGTNSVRLSLAMFIWLAMCLALLFICTMPNLFFAFDPDATSSMLALIVSSVSSVVLLLGAILFLLPLASGVILFAKLTVDGKAPGFIELFAPFKSARAYFHSIEVPMVLLIRAIVVLLPLVGGVMSWSVFCAECYGAFVVFTVAFELCLTLAATAVGAYISSFLFFVPYLMLVDNKGFFAALCKSIALGKGRRTQLVGISVRALFDAVLSALSFMILWVVYAMPRMSVSYFVYCNKVVKAQTTNNE